MMNMLQMITGVVELKDLDGEGYYDDMRHVTMRKIKREYS